LRWRGREREVGGRRKKEEAQKAYSCIADLISCNIASFKKERGKQICRKEKRRVRGKTTDPTIIYFLVCLADGADVVVHGEKEGGGGTQ